MAASFFIVPLKGHGIVATGTIVEQVKHPDEKARPKETQTASPEGKSESFPADRPIKARPISGFPPVIFTTKIASPYPKAQDVLLHFETVDSFQDALHKGEIPRTAETLRIQIASSHPVDLKPALEMIEGLAPQQTVVLSFGARDGR
jgi:hypothetical protein